MAPSAGLQSHESRFAAAGALAMASASAGLKSTSGGSSYCGCCTSGPPHRFGRARGVEGPAGGGWAVARGRGARPVRRHGVARNDTLSCWPAPPHRCSLARPQWPAQALTLSGHQAARTVPQLLQAPEATVLAASAAANGRWGYSCRAARPGNPRPPGRSPGARLQPGTPGRRSPRNTAPEALQVQRPAPQPGPPGLRGWRGGA
mmetsp:Transcript_50776/g.157180  ORF Transcript_50776/g.157180 Transcript_50776/m.157180 type:complete len:204 (+) Transcript_50776:346-957(+)